MASRVAPLVREAGRSSRWAMKSLGYQVAGRSSLRVHAHTCVHPHTCHTRCSEDQSSDAPWHAIHSVPACAVRASDRTCVASMEAGPCGSYVGGARAPCAVLPETDCNNIHFVMLNPTPVSAKKTLTSTGCGPLPPDVAKLSGALHARSGRLSVERSRQHCEVRGEGSWA